MNVTRIVLALALVGTATSSARAQLIAPTAGITVTGRGSVRVRADELRFVATLFAANGRVLGSTPPTPSPSPAADVDGAADAVAKALRADGITDAATGLTGNLNANAQRTVQGTLAKPTREKVDALLKDASAASVPFPNVVLQNLALSFLVDDCSAPETRAQNAALADARARAERVAHAGGLRLGAITAVNEESNFNGNFACATRPDTAPALNRSIGDSSTTGDVYVSVTAVVTYAIAH